MLLCKKPIQSVQDCTSVGLPQSYDDNSTMVCIEPRDCVIEITVGSQKDGFMLLGQFKDSGVIRPFVFRASIVRYIVPSLLKESLSSFREVLVQEGIHEALAS